MTQKKYTADECNQSLYMGFILGSIVIIVLGGIVLAAFGAFNNPIDELNLNKDAIASTHVLKYYPEYENCSIRYIEANKIDCELQIPGVEVYCQQVEDRDGMNVLGNNPSLTLCFDEITIEEVFKDIISNYK